MLFALHASDSKFCKDGLMIVNCQEKNKIKYVVVFDRKPETILLSFSQNVFATPCYVHRHVIIISV